MSFGHSSFCEATFVGLEADVTGLASPPSAMPGGTWNADQRAVIWTTDTRDLVFHGERREIAIAGRNL